MPATSTNAHDKNLVAIAKRPTALPAPLARAEARVTQVEVELRLTLAEALLSDLEAERDQINAELAELRSERDGRYWPRGCYWHPSDLGGRFLVSGKFLMPVFLYRCPNTGYRVQGFVAENTADNREPALPASGFHP
jgi:hypothetical protein